MTALVVLDAPAGDQDFDEGFLRAGVLAGAVAVPVGGLRQAFVDAGDVAAVAAVALSTDRHAGRVLELHGPEALTFDEAVATVARISGRQVRFDGSDQGFLDAQHGGLPVEAARQALPAFAALRRRGDDVPNGVVAEVTGRSPVAFHDDAAARGPGRREQPPRRRSRPRTRGGAGRDPPRDRPRASPGRCAVPHGVPARTAGGSVPPCCGDTGASVRRRSPAATRRTVPGGPQEPRRVPARNPQDLGPAPGSPVPGADQGVPGCPRERRRGRLAVNSREVPRRSR